MNADGVVAGAIAAPEPEGLGTALIENLGSWIARWAWMHRLAPGDLILDAIAPALGRPHVRGANKADWGPYFSRVLAKPPGSIHGRESYAATWVDAAERRTGRRDLRFLTGLPFRDVLPSRLLIRASGAFCRGCYADDFEAGRTIYDRLLWSMAPVMACIEHERVLDTHCPFCGHERPIIAYWASPGHCPRDGCGHWLGSTEPGATMSVDDLDWQRFAVRQIGDLLAAAPDIEPDLDIEGPVRLVRHAGATLGGNWNALARRIKMTDGTVWMWQAGSVMPSLGALLRLCRVTGVTMIEALTSTDLSAVEPPKSEPDVPPQLEHHVRVDPHRVEDELWVVARSDSAMPETLRSVCARMRFKESRARRLFPEPCRLIVARGAEYRARRGQLLQMRLRLEVFEAVRTIAREGGAPTRRAVAGRLRRPSLMREETAYQAWREARAELGAVRPVSEAR